MLNRFQGWRERGWSVVDASTYSDAWQRYGGSVATHPQVVERLAGLAEIPVRYLAWEHGGELKACIATWGQDLALSKDVLKRKGKKGLFDLGNAELILPAAADAQAALPASSCRPSSWPWRVPRKNCRRNFAITSAASCVCWKRRAVLCVRSRRSPVPSWRQFTVICSNAAGAFPPPAPSAWRR